ncbi:MAG: glycerophosphodiester phosphodiesterase family protein [Mycobacteriales bacterium]
MRTSPPIVIGHRGASGYRPEHTLDSFGVAIDLGADAIEPDVVSTKDHALIVRHENELSRTTDVASHEEFAHLRATKVVEGREVTGWFSEDFTLAEIRTLRCRERFADLRQQNTMYDGRYRVATLDEVLFLTRTQSLRTGRVIGCYPEIKHPAYFSSLGLPIGPALADTLRRHGLDRAFTPVVVQSFDAEFLREFRAALNVPLVQLVGLDSDPYLLTPVGQREISTYASAVGVDKQLLGDDLVVQAHAAGLRALVYTLRNENAFLDPQFRDGGDPHAYGRAFEEYSWYFRTGVDGVFSDNADTAVAARAEFVRDRVSRPTVPASLGERRA